MRKTKLKALGRRVTKFTKLETFPKPRHVHTITLISDEMTAQCPVTNQPDWYKIEVTYTPDKLAVESKTVKLFIQSFRDKGHFCEKLTSDIAEHFFKELTPFYIKVTMTQKPRGGVAIVSTAEIFKKEREQLNLSGWKRGRKGRYIPN